jgi:hypothetical protein
MGVVLHYALLAQAGIRARVVRPLDPPFLVPTGVAHASRVTLTFDPPISERMAAMAREYRESPAFFDNIVDDLLAGSERVVCLSLFRNNVDVSLWIARLVKERRPSTFVVLGGPEAIEEPPALLLPWVDAVVGGDAEAVTVPLIRALLDGRPALASGLRNVWLSPALDPEATDPAMRPPLSTPPLPVIDYQPLMPLFVGDAGAAVPLLMNWGCPYHCAFCSNRGIYSRFAPGSVERVLEEIDGILVQWRALHDGSPPQIGLQLSDATTNALPAQFDEFLRGVIDRTSKWGQRPFLRGQTLFDARITEERVRLWSEANFGNTFFGLDGASDGLRRSLQKPGSMAQVVAAMELYHRGGRGGLTFGMPVGIPGESEEHFREAERFVDGALKLEGTILSITVLPYVFFLSAQDPALGRMNRGERRGILWRADVPGGDPAERARRFMRLFERIDGRIPTTSPIAPYLALPAMLPDEDPARLEAWMDRYGHDFDQITPDNPKKTGRGKASGRAISGAWERAARMFEAGRGHGGWTMDGLEMRGADGEPPRLVVLFRRKDGGEPVAVVLEAHDPARKAFARTRDFNVSYQRDWRGLRCGFDEGLLRHCVRELQRTESVEEQVSSS